MLDQVNKELFPICEKAVSDIVNNIFNILENKLKQYFVSITSGEEMLNYKDYLSQLFHKEEFNKEEVFDKVKEWIEQEVNNLSKAELFTWYCFFIENNEVLRVEEEANVDLENKLPSTKELVEVIFSNWCMVILESPKSL